MRPICINGSPLCSTNITGIERYMYEIIIRLDKLSKETGIQIWIFYPQNKILNLPTLANIHLQGIPGTNGKVNICELRKWLKKLNGIYCSLSGNLCVQKGAIICIHDIRPWIYNTYDKKSFRLRCSVNFISSKLFARKVVTGSNTSKHEINKFLHIEEKRIQTIYSGWEHMQDIIDDENIFKENPDISKGNYYYSLSSQAPHKNFIWVTETAKNNPNDIFVVAGKRWNDQDEVANFPQNVKYLGYVTDSENKALMRNCKAFLHPAKYEGFGIPPLEALACGAQICVSKISCLPEIFEDCAHYFDPNDYSVNLDKLMKESVCPPNKLLEKYSWDRSTELWMDIFKQICN